MSDLLGHIFGLVCGQNPEHTSIIAGVRMPCCQRCVGLYIGAFGAILLLRIVRPALTRRFMWAHGAMLALMLPFGLYWISQGPTLRMLSGLSAGFGMTAFMWAGLGGSHLARPSSSRTALRLYTAWLLLICAVVPLLASVDTAWGAWLLAALVVAGLLALTLLAMKVVSRSLALLRDALQRCIGVVGS
jgi:uncharacterized membrane protein